VSRHDDDSTVSALSRPPAPAVGIATLAVERFSVPPWSLHSAFPDRSEIPLVPQTLRLPALSVRVLPDRERVVVAVAGELDLASVGELDRVVRDLRAVEWSEIALDLRRLDLIASAGLAWLLATQREAHAGGWTLLLVDGSPAVTRLLELTGTHDRFRWTNGV
jgi:anti-sigma B factor antagonist